MNVKNVLIIEGISQYGALNYFNSKIAEGFRSCGVNVNIQNQLPITNDGRIQGISENDLVFSFNGMVINDFDFEQSRAISRSKVTCWTFLVDHPYYHHYRLLNKTDRQIVSVIDRKHLEYLKKYYPEITDAVFLPHGGAMADCATIPFCDKQYDITFFGSYRQPEECLEKLKKYNEPMRKLLLQIVEEVLNGREKTLEDSVRKYFKAYNLLDHEEDLCEMMSELATLDEYVRYKRRDMMIRVALESGYKVHVFGKGWENFSNEEAENLILHESVDYTKSLNIMADSKIVLNNMPLFSDGSHERVFSILASGSLCLTDSNSYLEENFCDGQELFYYKWNDIYAMPELIKKIMSGRVEADKIIENGRKKVVDKHLWKDRAKAILDYCGNIPEGYETKNL